MLRYVFRDLSPNLVPKSQNATTSVLPKQRVAGSNPVPRSISHHRATG